MGMRHVLPRDPRWFQIAFLGSFVAAGLWLEIIPLWQVLPPIGAALFTQWACLKLRKLPSQGYLSPLITGLGLVLLLRTDLVWLPPVAAVAAIGSKFFVRFGGKHIFNPANLGLALAMLLTSHAWASPSQWGESAALMFWFLALGMTVVVRALRSDISFAFLAIWAALKLARVLWLGAPHPLDVLEHQLVTGSLIVFTFFMISDPKTTPDSRLGRLIYAGVVAGVAFVMQHHFWIQNSPVWALFFLSPLVPLIDRLVRGVRYQWPSFASPQLTPTLNPAGAR
jgi:Na+-transporting NADH:ubiquinone oxidoreductase subunit NqrB